MAIRLRIGKSGAVHALLASVGVALTLASSSPASAYEVKKTPSGEPVHWSGSSLTYHLNPSVADAADDAAAAITAAAAAWSGLEGAPTLSVVQGGGGAAPGFDCLNTIFYAPKGSALTGGALAVTVVTSDNTTGQALDADIIIDGRFHFAVLPASSVAPSGVQPVSNEGMLLGPTSSDPFDLQHIAAHELGHSLGLADDTTNEGEVMFLYSAPGAASPRGPQTDDTAGIASLYDTGSSSSGGCGGAAISPRTPTNAASRIALTFLVGLVAWGLTRRARGVSSRSLGLAAIALTTFALLPGEPAARSAAPSPTSRAPSRARVTGLDVRVDANGIFTTRAKLSTTVCGTRSCPTEGAVTIYGGTLGNVHQEIAGAAPPREGDEIAIEFDEETLEARLVAR